MICPNFKQSALKSSANFASPSVRPFLSEKMTLLPFAVIFQHESHIQRQVTIPQGIRERCGTTAGTEINFTVHSDEVVSTKTKQKGTQLDDWLRDFVGSGDTGMTTPTGGSGRLLRSRHSQNTSDSLSAKS